MAASKKRKVKALEELRTRLEAGAERHQELGKVLGELSKEELIAILQDIDGFLVSTKNADVVVNRTGPKWNALQKTKE